MVVLSNNDGCIIARSPEAKALGVRMGEPYFKRKQFFTKNKIVVFSANFTLYGDFSDRVMQVLSTFTPDIEVYSIDESFLDLHGFFDLEAYGKQIKETVYQYVGIPVGVGIASTKTLAKLANYVAKKQSEYNGCCFLKDMETTDRICGNIPIAEVWGIGHRYATMLGRHRVNTVADFKALSEKWVYKQMTVTGLRTHRELHGKPSISMEDAVPPKKAICTSRSFGKSLETFEEIEEALCTFGANAARKLRRQKGCTSIISVFLETNPFQFGTPQYNNSQTIHLPCPTDSTLVINQYACYALKKIFRKGYYYKKTGITLTDFTPRQEQQLDLFSTFSSPKHRKIMDACDKLTEKYGIRIVKTAREGTQEPFKMRQNNLSQRYTTRISELLVIKI
ncbi:Y-family DNA polymerase [Chondrinema litorale]|uniref:Y-family DNA polymerase n=1 Tax=Chondrinema litorale TaxID=2994555 RepID=UPI0025431F13|nr:Y-family DNA polymerase [Chondrinema litorale]UZR95205.1 Y-family DNA polymerase [Chondrinema litorale]